MHLFVLTIIYCILTQFFNVGYSPALGIYLISISLVKGFLSEELSDVFNLKKTHVLYKENGVKNSILDLISLLLIFGNSYVIDYESFTPFEFIVMFFTIAVVYRFLFLGTSRVISAKFKRTG